MALTALVEAPEDEPLRIHPGLTQVYRDRAEPEDDGECDRELQTGGQGRRPAVAPDCDAVGGCGDVGEDGCEPRGVIRQ